MKYKNNIISCSMKDLEQLKQKGWNIQLIGTNYVSPFGVNAKGLHIGFHGYLDNLSLTLETDDVGFYNEYWKGELKITNQADLDKIVKIIDLFCELIKNQ